MVEDLYRLVLLVQEFIKEAEGKDLRCFVIDGKIVASIERTAAPGEFRGSSISGGNERIVKAGDVVFIPPGVPHGMKQTESFTYLNIRFEARDDE